MIAYLLSTEVWIWGGRDGQGRPNLESVISLFGSASLTGCSYLINRSDAYHLSQEPSPTEYIRKEP